MNRAKLLKLIADKKAQKEQTAITISTPAVKTSKPHSAAVHSDKKPEKKKIQLSALQLSMQKQLTGAQFRLINEQLYTIESEAALKLMENDPSLFDAYHVGFRSQVEAWPINPLDAMIDFASTLPPGSVIIDMGCGDAKLQESINKTHPCFKVKSFDLVSVNPRVTACDMKNVPLVSGTADCVVFCLALMGLNFLDFIKEAERLLKVNGAMKIAEVESRFVEVDEFIGAIEDCGFRLLEKNVKQKMFYTFTFQKGKRAEKKRGKKQREESEEESEEESKPSKKVKTNVGLLLKPCIYKRR